MPISAACSTWRVSAAQRRDQTARGHRAGNADLALAADLRAGDGRVLLVEDADGGGGQKVAKDALLVRAGDMKCR